MFNFLDKGFEIIYKFEAVIFAWFGWRTLFHGYLFRFLGFDSFGFEIMDFLNSNGSLYLQGYVM